MTRSEWKRKKFMRSIPFYPQVPFTVLCIILSIFVLYFGGKIICADVYNFVIELQAKKEVKRQEKVLYDEWLAQEMALEEEEKYREAILKQKEYKEMLEQREKKEKLILEVAKKFKVGTRFKVYSTTEFVPLGNETDNDGNQKFRPSIIDIDNVKSINGTMVTGLSGIEYNYEDGLIEKVSSNREWADLVYLKLEGKLEGGN